MGPGFSGWCLIMGLCLGLPAAAGSPQATLFNRTGHALQLVPKATEATQPRNQFQITSHDLGRLRVTRHVVDFAGEQAPVVAVPPDGLICIQLLKESGLAGGLAFEVVSEAQPGQPGEVLGSLSFTMEALAGACCTSAPDCLAAPYFAEPLPAKPWKLILRRHSAAREARERAWDAERAEADEADRVARASRCVIL